MAFLFYRRNNGFLKNTGETFKLAGYNLIFQLWQTKGKPTDQGWHITADDLIRLYSGGTATHDTGALIIDFDPTSKWRIGLVELLDIYLYTYRGSSKDTSGWSPMMLCLKDILYEEYDHMIKPDEKDGRITELTEPQNSENSVEFLYLNGSDKGWNWGRNGMTNAAFLQGSARDYFRQFF
jgi:hypothetical protein